jgi:hypothetical protein
MAEAPRQVAVTIVAEMADGGQLLETEGFRLLGQRRTRRVCHILLGLLGLLVQLHERGELAASMANAEAGA